ncbi:MAG: glycosyltransferase family 1 protein, partial [Pirellulaceae bacterium]|nr:glycosyltransferase family 1 protein [Pirellulaceae bacterium]
MSRPMNALLKREVKRVAFVSTRISGTDGVSLEIAKWADVIERMGVECYYITGLSDRPPDKTVLIEEAHFDHPDILDMTRRAFGVEVRSPRLTNDIMQMANKIRDELDRAIRQLDIDVLIAENALTIPMNLPLGVALVNEIQERVIGCVAHHHDFFWERDRFLINAVDDII